MRRFADSIQRRSPMRIRTIQMANYVLHNHDRTINNHAEVKRTQRKKISRDVSEIKAYRSKQQREGNRERYDDRSADISEEQKQDDHDEEDAVTKIAKNCLCRVMDEVAAVEIRHDLYTFRQNLLV